MAGSIASSSENADYPFNTQTHSSAAASAAIPISRADPDTATSQPRPATRTRKDIVVIVDTKVEQYQALASTIVGRNDVPIIVLTSDRNSIEQITEILQSYAGIVRLYLISQNYEQAGYPGTTCLNRFNLDAYGWQLQQWAESLSNQATILLCGCQITDYNQRQAFVQRLSLLTGATVLAQ